VCCITQQSATCTAPNACQGFALVCSGTASCPNGDVCCLDFQGQNQPPVSSCQPQCQQGFGHFQLCDSNADCSGGRQCRRGFGGLSTCR
jgi:hypothetical protein